LSSLVEFLFEIVQQITMWLGYPGIFLLLLIENLIPPVPLDMVVPFGGALVAQGRLSFAGVLISGTLGSVLGAVIVYYLGSWLGRDRLESLICRYGKYLFFSVHDLHKILDLFQRHGKWSVFVARMVPGARSVISIPAGVNHMPLGTFLGLTLLGTLMWNTLLLGAGYMLGHNWTRVLEVLDRYEAILLAAAIILLLYFLARKYQHRGSDPIHSGCEEHEG
jgi:membrane protein DedA with SNARE-associated domain